MKQQDLYQLLGLRRDASQEEIKKAYRELAKRHHPDRTQNNPRDTEIFKAVAMAFATLSNPQKRAEYDRTLAASERQATASRGREPPTSRAGFASARTPFDEILGEFFGDFFQARTSWPLERDERILEIILTPEEAMTGVTIPVDIPWKGRCPLCQGTGLAPFSICSGCRGSGFALGERRITLTIPPGVPSGTTQRLCLAHNQLSIRVRVKVR
jgi:DnaJ-class molecular chaperone